MNDRHNQGPPEVAWFTQAALDQVLSHYTKRRRPETAGLVRSGKIGCGDSAVITVLCVSTEEAQGVTKLFKELLEAQRRSDAERASFMQSVRDQAEGTQGDPR